MNTFRKLCALILSLCLLAAVLSPALAEETAGDEVTRSDFSLSLLMHADGFPNDGAAHYADWEAFLSKLSLEGVIDVQRFLTNVSRVYFDGGLCLNGKMTLPFVYDGYHSYRYVRADALRGDSIHFQMHNFFEFMLKGYYFMGLPTQLIALPLYPEASYYLGTSYYQPIAEALAGEGDRTVSYAELYELCETLDLIVNDDWDYERAYFYFTCLLTDLGASDLALQKLGYLEDWLAFMDPEEKGLFITDDGVSQTYTLGNTQVFAHTRDASGERFTLCLPDSDGYELTAAYENTGAEIHGSLRITLEGAERLTPECGCGRPARGWRAQRPGIGHHRLWRRVLLPAAYPCFFRLPLQPRRRSVALRHDPGSRLAASPNAKARSHARLSGGYGTAARQHHGGARLRQSERFLPSQ